MNADDDRVIEDRYALDAASEELLTYLARRVAHFAEIRERMDAMIAEIASALEGIPEAPTTEQQEFLDDRMKGVADARARLDETRKDIVAASARMVGIADFDWWKLSKAVSAKGWAESTPVPDLKAAVMRDRTGHLFVGGVDSLGRRSDLGPMALGHDEP